MQENLSKGTPGILWDLLGCHAKRSTTQSHKVFAEIKSQFSNQRNGNKVPVVKRQKRLEVRAVSDALEDKHVQSLFWPSFPRFVRVVAFVALP